jgi:hypothetical protein
MGMLFASTLELACVGIDIVNKALAFRRGVPKPAYEKDREFEDLLSASEKSLKYVISVNADLVIEKIEQDKLEELSSRVKNIGMLIKLDRTDELMSYMMLLNESVDYASNRINENKEQWIAPYLMGKSMSLAVLNYLEHDDEHVLQDIIVTTNDIKYKLLNRPLEILMSSKRDIPWDLYYDVLNNAPGSVPKLIKKIKECSLKDSCVNEIESKVGTPDMGQEKMGGIKGDSKIDEKVSVMFCRKCGGKLIPNAAFCKRCGSKAV